MEIEKVVLHTICKNYGYGSFLGVLTYVPNENYKKVYLEYFQILPNGILLQMEVCTKETLVIEKLARKYINEKDLILWSC